jgi:hypothetical protein
MSAALALILLAEAAAACPPAGPVQLPGGATVVRPVGTDKPLPFEQLGPATGIEKSDAIRQTGADAEPASPDADSTAEQCSERPIQIV